MCKLWLFHGAWLGENSLQFIGQNLRAASLVVGIVWDGIIPFGVDFFCFSGRAFEDVESRPGGSHASVRFVLRHHKQNNFHAIQLFAHIFLLSVTS